MKVYTMNISKPISDEKYNHLINCVSNEKRARIEKFHFIDDAKRTLYGDILVRYLACKLLNISNEKLMFSALKLGKPFLIGYPDFHYNIAHSGEWVVCAVSNREVGVDIEQVKQIDFGIAKRFFTEYEYNELMTKPQSEQVEYFYTIWTLKESYIKCIGKGLSEPLNSFGFRVNGDKAGLSDDRKDQYYFNWQNIEEYKLAVCTMAEMSDIEVQECDIYDIFEI